MAHGISDRVDGHAGRLRMVGNAVVPQVAEFIGRRIMDTLSVLR
jgi:site-specific DNA-cytosine methylase